MRDILMVKDQNDIPASEQVRQYYTCAVGHPGVCRTADAEIYMFGAFLLRELNSFVVSQGRVAEGQGLSLSARRNGVDEPLLQMWLIVAYKRKGDPILFVCASLHAVDGAADVFDIVTANSTIPMLVGHSIVGALLRHGPDQVLVASMEFVSLPGFLLRVRVASIGDAVDIFSKEKIAAKTKTMEAKEDQKGCMGPNSCSSCALRPLHRLLGLLRRRRRPSTRVAISSPSTERQPIQIPQIPLVARMSDIAFQGASLAQSSRTGGKAAVGIPPGGSILMSDV